MADATLANSHNALPRQGIAANDSYTVQIDPLWPDAGTTYTTAARPIKVINHMGGLLFVRPGPTCTIDDPNADMVPPGGYVNTYPSANGGLITVISDTDTVVSFIRKP